jgi:hypothetical protein
MTEIEREFEIAELLEEAKEQERFEKFIESIPSMRDRVKTKEAHLPLLHILSNDDT